MNKKNILIFPGGSEIGIEIFNALKYSKFFKIFGGTSTCDHAPFIYESLISLPFIDDAEFINVLNLEINKNHIDYIYPALDVVQMFLMKEEKNLHAKVVSAPYETVILCNNKKKTYEKFLGESFVPKYYESPDDVEENNLPVFVKPLIGCGSKGAHIVYTKSELVKRWEENSEIVICEYLPGEEFTVDCFTDKNGNLLCSRLRSRDRIKMGISVHSASHIEEFEVLKIAEKLNQGLQFIGAWFFQLKKDLEGKYKLLEVATRIPGTIGVSRNNGINFEVLTLFALEGYDVSLIDQKYDVVLDRSFICRYSLGISFSHVYIDFDDTIRLPNGKLNVVLIQFLYQCKNDDKKLILLSKHIKDIKQSLKDCFLNEELFDEIIIVEPTDKKYKYIKYSDSIFIDDSFAERQEVNDKTGIAVFDLDMLESLLNWRM